MKQAHDAGTSVRLPGDGVMLAAEAFGPADAPPVMFFHGGGQSRRSWRGAARALGAAGYRALTFDLRGHGESGWAADGDYLLDAYARDVERLLGTFGRPATLVGASRGGQAALVGGSRHPHKLSLIMLADVAPDISDAGVDRIRDFFRNSSAGFTSLDDAAAVLSVYTGFGGNAAGLAKVMRIGEDGRFYWHWDPNTVRPEFLKPPSEMAAIEAAAGRVLSPVVLVRAERSDVVTDEGVRKFHELTPQLEVIEAAGVGHMFTGDRNDAFARDLLGYLARHAPLGA